MGDPSITGSPCKTRARVNGAAEPLGSTQDDVDRSGAVKLCIRQVGDDLDVQTASAAGMTLFIVLVVIG